MVKNEKESIVIELTVPYEERADEAHERKRLKYQELVEQCQEKMWKTWRFPIEVGCRGFHIQSVLRTLGSSCARRKMKTRQSTSFIQKFTNQI